MIIIMRTTGINKTVKLQTCQGVEFAHQNLRKLLEARQVHIECDQLNRGFILANPGLVKGFLANDIELSIRKKYDSITEVKLTYYESKHILKRLFIRQNARSLFRDMQKILS